MARGTPDYGIYPYQQAQSQGDMSQIPLMLWGFAPLDYKGRMYYLDTFNNGLGGWFDSTRLYPGTHVSLESVDSSGRGVAYVPPKACRIYSDNVVDKVTLIERSGVLYSPNRIGLETGLTYTQQAGNLTLSFYYYSRDTYRYLYMIRWSQIDKAWFIHDHDATMHKLLDYDLYLMSTVTLGLIKFQLKLVLDLTLSRYDYMLIADKKIDLSAYSPVKTPGAVQDIYKHQYSTQPKTSDYNKPWYIGYSLMTTDEP